MTGPDRDDLSIKRRRMSAGAWHSQGMERPTTLPRCGLCSVFYAEMSGNLAKHVVDRIKAVIDRIEPPVDRIKPFAMLHKRLLDIAKLLRVSVKHALDLS
jgi:hypothetical protein